MIIFVIIVSILTIALIILSAKFYQKSTCGYCRVSAHMVGRVVIVTGGNTGIGFETAKDLAYRGARVILACRNMNRANAAKDLITKETGNMDVHCHLLDLKSLRSVREFCEHINKTEKRLDVLINNAAATGYGNRKSEDGINLGMQVNYFSQFLLICLLLPLLKSSAPSRILNVSSAMHMFGKIDFDDLNMEKTSNEFLIYANSKLFINLMTLELSRKLKSTGVTANSLHPGIATTGIYLKFHPALRVLVVKFIELFLHSVWEASQTSIYLAVSPEVREVSGKYFSLCRDVTPSKKSLDEDMAARLWVESEKFVKHSLPTN